MTRQTRRQLVDRKIVELLVIGTGVNALMRNLHVSKRRIRALREKARAHGYLTEDGQPGTVKLPPYPESLFPDVIDGRADQGSDLDALLAPQAEWIRERLTTGWHAVTVYEELKQPEVSRSSFYRYLERHQLTRWGETHRVIPEIVHQPGEALLLDWGKLRDVPDPTTGRRKTLWFLAGVLGFSRYLMVRLVWAMNLETTLIALESFLREIKGVPARLTTDNPKCFALQASRYEPILNPGIERFAAHYGVMVECLPPRDPQKKGKIERPVPYVRRLYEAHGETWVGIEESQSYLDGKMVLANQRRHGTTQKRPIDLLVEERAALKPLPPTAYAVEQFHEGPVRKDGHVRFEHKYYSVDESYCGKSVVVLGGRTHVSIYCNGKLLEVHDRLTDPHRSKSTKPHHLKPWERSLQEDSPYRQRARALGPQVDAMIEKILIQGEGFIDLRKVWGILSLDKRHDAARIDEACGRALVAGQVGYQAVKRWIEWDERVRPLSANVPSVEHTPATSAPHQYVRSLAIYQEQVDLFPNTVKSEIK